MLATGERAPDISLSGIDGERYASAEARRSGWLLLAFFELTCPTSQLSFLYWDRLHEAHASDGFTFWAVSTDPAKDAASFAEKSGVTFPILVDSDLDATNQFGVVATPSHFLIGKDGVILASFDGFDKAALNELVSRVAEKRGVPPSPIVGDEAPDFRPACTLLRLASL